MATYRYHANDAASLLLNERPVYGSARLGSLRQQMELLALPNFDAADANPVQNIDLNYELTDHLGNVCAVVTGRLLDGNGGGTPKQAELVSAQGYEPFGSLLPGRNYSSSSYNYGFNGKWKDDEVHGATGTSYDFGARMQDPRTGRWLSLDPLAVKYPEASPYAFALNTPIQAKDPDGRVVIFINGNHYGDGGKAAYWRQYQEKYVQTRAPQQWMDPGEGHYEKQEVYAFDKNIMAALGDNNARYVDGAWGGWAPLNNYNMSPEMRQTFGYMQGIQDAEDIICNLKRDECGNIVETIKIVSHSMGGATAKGYSQALLDYAAANNINGVVIEFEADFSPFQPGSQAAVDDPNMGPTYQFSHSKDRVAGDDPIEGAVQMDTSCDPGQGHSIFDYKGQESTVGTLPGKEP